MTEDEELITGLHDWSQNVATVEAQAIFARAADRLTSLTRASGDDQSEIGKELVVKWRKEAEAELSFKGRAYLKLCARELEAALAKLKE